MAEARILFTGDQGAGSLKIASMQGWRITVDAQAIPAERYAAAEFQRLFREAAGIDLAVGDNTEEGARSVRIGKGAADTADLGDEGLRVVVGTDRVAIAGGQPRGTLYGVYQFMEDGLGIRFLTHDHTHIPADAARAEIPCGEWSCVPPFSFRWSYYQENAAHPDFAARLRVNTVELGEELGGRTPQNLINHSFHTLVPFGEYGTDHPEYYAVFEGKRDTDTHGAGPQLCVTNPEVLEIASETVIKHLGENPDLRNVSVSQADTARYCHCDVCEEINQREGTPMGSNLTFVNAVAERVEEKHPRVKIGTLAYWYTRQRPKTIRPRHNVQIQLCSIECCIVHPINDPECEKNRAFCSDMDNWGAVCDDIWVWNYNTNFRAYDLPFPNLRVIGPNIRYFLSNSVKGLFMQANGSSPAGEVSDLRNHLISRLIWNPSLDDRSVIEEFVQLHYRSAASAIMDYLDMLHDNAEQMLCHPACFPAPEEVGLTPEIARQAFEQFGRAEAAADDEAVRARVEKASICAYRALIDAGELKADERRTTIDRYIELAQRHGMSHASEGTQASLFFEELRAG